MGTDTEAAGEGAGLRDCVSLGQEAMTAAIAVTAVRITAPVPPEDLRCGALRPSDVGRPCSQARE